MIELRGIEKVFNAGKPNEFRAVEGVNLSVEVGMITVIKGPSGSGKTTLLGIIGCMARPTSGRIYLSGRLTQVLPFAVEEASAEVTSLPEKFLTDIRRRGFGFIFQQFNLIKGITVLENVMLPAYPEGEDFHSLSARAEGLLQAFNLSGKVSSRVEWLSGGEAQRVAIARALINNPAVVIADEPTAHLDTKLSGEFMAIMAQLRDKGETVIIASHDPIVYDAPIVDRVVEMRDGRIGAERRTK
ncbi:MAG TPA: ABC transporter ATP-binding protein [Thermodesulfovibrionales bacterium]|jgi:putative ABC transport system ATP-binding protein|nr:ABC transporter ATP-binding protein [Thermodesulfovibrionales bacterium]